MYIPLVHACIYTYALARTRIVCGGSFAQVANMRRSDIKQIVVKCVPRGNQSG
jgi:hypothetical protein